MSNARSQTRLRWNEAFEDLREASRQEAAARRLALDPSGPDAGEILRILMDDDLEDIRRAYLWQRYADLRDLSFDAGRAEIADAIGRV